MMRTLTRASAVAALAVALAACSTVETVPPPGAPAPGYGPMTQLVETPSSRVDREIPESQRIAWYEAQRPRAAVVYRPAQVERVVVRREVEPVRYVERSPRWDGWYLPFALSLGWWGGHRHRDHGWGWGLGWHNGWGW